MSAAQVKAAVEADEWRTAQSQFDKAAEIIETMAARVRGHLAEIDALTQSAAAEDGDGASPT